MAKKLTGNEFANALAALKEGGKVTINAPFRDFTFKGEYGKIGMLSKLERMTEMQKPYPLFGGRL